MATIFLRVKHWQLFLLLVVLWIGSGAAQFAAIPSSSGEPARAAFPFVAVGELVVLVFAGWLWSVGNFLQSVVPQRLKMSPTLFRISVILPLLCIPLSALVFESLNLAVVGIVFIAYGIALAGEVYSWYFVARSLALAQYSRQVRFSDYEATLLGIWFFPFGIWFIQPKINRLYAKSSENLSLGQS
jgi:hypothetical protein